MKTDQEYRTLFFEVEQTYNIEQGGTWRNIETMTVYRVVGMQFHPTSEQVMIVVQRHEDPRNGPGPLLVYFIDEFLELFQEVYLNPVWEPVSNARVL